MIVRLSGGLGNQMFCYAFGKSLSLARCEPVFFHKVGLDNGNHRAYSLGVFNTDVQFKDPDASNPVYQEKTFAYDNNVLDAPPNSYFIGNWQTEKYFVPKTFLKDLTPKIGMSVKSVEWKMKMLNKAAPSCAIHVRRSDYLNVQHYHGIMDLNWYGDAIHYVLKESASPIRFFVFSDDPTWCKQNFPSSVEFRGVKHKIDVVDANGFGDGTNGPSTEHEDLELMAFCDHAIIPNSSFGWWGAYLGDKVSEQYKIPRIVIAPKTWFNPTGEAKHLDTSDVVPQRWVRL